MLLLASLWFVIYYALHLALSPSQEELDLYKSLGATNAFIRRPFLYLGAWYGAIGALIGSILSFILVQLVKSPLHNLTTAYLTTFELKGITLNFIICLTLLGAVLGWVSALLILGKVQDTSR